MSDEELPETECAHVGEFVQEYLLVIINRHINGRDRFWCSQWWKHVEAVERLNTLWISWEQVRLDPTQLGAWWRDMADYHLSVLMSSTGPMRHCKNGFHEQERYERESFPILPYPEGLGDLHQ